MSMGSVYLKIRDIEQQLGILSQQPLHRPQAIAENINHVQEKLLSQELADALCHVAMASGRLELAEHYAKQFDAPKVLDQVLQRKQGKRLIQSKILQILPQELLPEINQETQLLDRLIRFEAIKATKVDMLPVNNLLLQAYLAAENGFIGWDMMVKQLIDMSDIVRVNDQQLSNKLIDIAQVTLELT